MDFLKVKSLVEKSILVDTASANPYMLRVNYNQGDESCWLVFAPGNYKNEEELAQAIKQEVAKKLFDTPNASPTKSL